MPLHGVIRAYTQYSLRPVNLAVSKWLEQDVWFKTAAITCAGSDVLVQKLRELEIHLMLWHAKYKYWMPATPEPAVVFMADEKKHGLGFPPQTAEAVDAVLQHLRQRWLKGAQGSRISHGQIPASRITEKTLCLDRRHARR